MLLQAGLKLTFLTCPLVAGSIVVVLFHHTPSKPLVWKIPMSASDTTQATNMVMRRRMLHQIKDIYGIWFCNEIIYLCVYEEEGIDLAQTSHHTS